MIFVKKDEKTLWIPRHVPIDQSKSPYRLELKHNLTSRLYKYPELVNNVTTDNCWVFLYLDLSQLGYGDYEYTLYNSDNEELERGLLNVECVEKEPISYKNNQNTIVYNGK